MALHRAFRARHLLKLPLLDRAPDTESKIRGLTNVYIYIYIYRERESNTYVNVCVYIYNYSISLYISAPDLSSCRDRESRDGRRSGRRARRSGA